MKFRVGQDVYIRWVPDHRCRPNGRPHRCSVGVITAGPFEPLATVPGYSMITSDWSWIVHANGTDLLAAERILEPIDDDPVQRSRGQSVKLPQIVAVNARATPTEKIIDFDELLFGEVRNEKGPGVRVPGPSIVRTTQTVPVQDPIIPEHPAMSSVRTTAVLPVCSRPLGMQGRETG